MDILNTASCLSEGAANYNSGQKRQTSEIWAILASAARDVAGLMSIWYKSFFLNKIHGAWRPDFSGVGELEASRKDSHNREEIRCQTSASRSLSGLKILVVDDSKTIRRTAETLSVQGRLSGVYTPLTDSMRCRRLPTISRT